jgi:hypothetical protein
MHSYGNVVALTPPWQLATFLLTFYSRIVLANLLLAGTRLETVYPAGWIPSANRGVCIFLLAGQMLCSRLDSLCNRVVFSASRMDSLYKLAGFCRSAVWVLSPDSLNSLCQLAGCFLPATRILGLGSLFYLFGFRFLPEVAIPFCQKNFGTVRIRIRGSVPLTYGSGSCSFRQ